MLTAQQYLELIRDRGERRLELSRVYRNIQREDLFLAAYTNVQSNKGAMTPGTDPNDTVDGMSLKRIRKIIMALENGEYRCKPTRRILIPKANGKLRPLSIPNFSDKLVQEVLRMTLEAYYEPQFSDHSHGFRPKRGCHTALDEIKNVWTGTKWFIEGDIKGCFDNIDHDTLLGILENKIKDNRLIKLIRHMLKAGYIENWQYNRTYSGTPQGGVISPLLANIYLSELDRFIETELLPRYNKGNRTRNPEYERTRRMIKHAKSTGADKLVIKFTKHLRTQPSKNPIEPIYRRLRYIRYADDFLLGFCGPKEEAEEIKQEIGKFLKERLKLDMAEDKTFITHAASTPANFLGYNILTGYNNNKITDGRRKANGRIQLRVPTDVVRKWTKKYMRAGIPYQRPELLKNTDYDITMDYELELRGITHYYSRAINVTRFYRLKHVMMESLVMTLASKHKTSKNNIYRKHSTVFDTGMKGLRVEIEREGKPTLRANFGSQPIRRQRVAGRLNDERWRPIISHNQLADRLLANECELCGSNIDVEVHHIRKLADIKKKHRNGEKPAWAIKMAAIRRKTLVVCNECHLKITHGTYDATAISSWRAG